MGTHSGGTYASPWNASSGVSKISLKEIFNFDKHDGGSSQTLFTQVMDNVKDNWWQLGSGMVGIAVAKKVLPKTGVPRLFNKAVRSAGLGQLVKM